MSSNNSNIFDFNPTIDELRSFSNPSFASVDCKNLCASGNSVARFIRIVSEMHKDSLNSIEIKNCRLTSGLNFYRRALTVRLQFKGCSFSDIQAEDAVCEQAPFLPGHVSARHCFSLIDSEANGLSFFDCSFIGNVALDRSYFRGHVLFKTRNFRSTHQTTNIAGTIRLPSANIEGNLDISGCRLNAEKALLLDDVAIKGRMRVEDSTFNGDLQAIKSDIRGVLDFSRSDFKGSICFDEGTLQSGLFVVESALGRFSANYAEFGGRFIIDNSALRGDFSAAGASFSHIFSVSNCTIGASAGLIFNEGQGLKSFHLSSATFQSGIEVDNSVFFSSVALQNAKVNMHVRFRNCEIHAPRSDHAFDCSRANIHSNLDYLNGRIFGRVRLQAITCHSLNINKSKIVGLSDVAVVAFGMVISGRLSFNGSSITGGLACGSSRIEDAIDFTGSEITSSSQAIADEIQLEKSASLKRLSTVAISLEDTTLRVLKLDRSGAEQIRGSVDLRRASIGFISDSMRSWPNRDHGHFVFLDGAKIDSLESDFFFDNSKESSNKRVSRVLWLLCQPNDHLGERFRSQPWESVSAILRRQGDHDDARFVEEQKRRRIADRSGVLARIKDRLFWYSSGYGARPFWSTTWLIGFLIGFSILWANVSDCNGDSCAKSEVFKRNSPRQYIVTRAGVSLDEYPKFNSIVYSADLLIPLIDFGYQGLWVPDVSKGGVAFFVPYFEYDNGRYYLRSSEWSTASVGLTKGVILYALRFLHMLIGLVFTSLVVLGLSGLLKGK